MKFLKLALLICLLGLSLSSAHAGQLKITVQNIDDEGGMIRAVVYDKANYLTHHAPYVQKQPAKPGDMVFTFADIPVGDWGVLAYHDVNENEDLDRNFLGIPTEQFGFSNNPGYNHQPEFSEVIFPLTAEPKEITIKLSN